MPVLVGGMGLGVEVSYWYMQQQAMQNAADTAAVAAATAGGTSYDEEARGVAARYGFVHGVNNVSVAVHDNAACPSGGTGCFRVTITKLVPLFLSPVVGYAGNATVTSVQNGGTVTSKQTALAAAAVARREDTPRKYCILAMGEDGAKWDFLLNGGAKSDLDNCGIMSNDTLNCNGNGGIAPYADSPHGDPDPSACGLTAHTRPAQKIVDPYEKLTVHIPTFTCAGYTRTSIQQSTLATSDAEASGLDQKDLPNTVAIKPYCGDVQLTGDVNFGASPTVLVIKNGDLDLDGHKLSGSALTVIFTGSDGTTSHIPKGSKNGSALAITAPTTGPWKGVALYQDPRLTTNIDITEAGNSPTWDITGLVYLPNAAVIVKGVVNKDATEAACFVMLVDSLTVSGTGKILTNGDKCDDIGLSLPAMQRGRLAG